MALLDLDMQRGVMLKLEGNRKRKRIMEKARASAKRQEKKEQLKIEAEKAKAQAIVDEKIWLEQERRNRLVTRWAQMQQDRKDAEAREIQEELDRIEAERKAAEE